jgi:hypothetical protein
VCVCDGRPATVFDVGVGQETRPWTLRSSDSAESREPRNDDTELPEDDVHRSMNTKSTTVGPEAGDRTGEAENVQVWMVERTFSEDSPNILVVVYATPDGARYLRKEWAYNRFGRTAAAPSVTAARTADPDRLAPVGDRETRERYAAEAIRMMERHDPGDPV